MKLLKHFQDNISSSITGGKARRLTELYVAGFPVPRGLILTFDIKLDKENADVLASEIDQWLQLHPEISSVAVRSSASLEDGNQFSFAGQFETYLHLKSTHSIIEAIHQCRASLQGEKVKQYIDNHRIDPQQLHVSVIIQEQIHSEASGVVFTVNPMTGNDKLMVIEAAFGQGEAMVQGSIQPDNYFYQWYDDALSIQSKGRQTRKLDFQEDGEGLVWKDVPAYDQVLTEEQIRQLCKICLDLQVFYGEPLDIEWAYANHQFYVLQARPVTHIHFDVEDEWTTADLKDGGISSSVTTPMMFSLYAYIFEHTMPDYLRQLHILPRKPVIKKWFNSWFGFSYWNMYGTKIAMKRLPGFNERNFDTSLGIHPDYEGNGQVTRLTPDSLITGIRALLATNRSIKHRIKNCQRQIHDVHTFFDELNKFLQHNPGLAEIRTFFNQMILKDYLQIEGSYFYTIYDNSNAATFCQEAIDKINKTTDDPIQYLHLVTGLTNLAHLRPGMDLWKIAEIIKKDAKAYHYFVHSDASALKYAFLSTIAFPYRSEIQTFVGKYKHHSLRELDLLVPNWGDDPQQVFDMLLFYLTDKHQADPALLEKKQLNIYSNELKRIQSKSLLKKVQAHREMLWWREEMRDHSSKMYHEIRRILLIIGDKMVEKQWILHRDDVFFLTFKELSDVTDANHLSYQSLIEKNKMFYQSFRNFKNPNEIWNKKNGNERIYSDNDKNTFQGIGGSQGLVQGRAVVIHSIFEADKIKEGDILVTRFTDPAWTCYFSRIAGLVTESGGILSHGAVVSREFGIPAVMGVENITHNIKTGDIIQVDGSSGLVVLVDK